ncbi:hypothetical protein [Halobacillus yeomjeoni]|uniref:Pilus assembly protein PilO n=1 Tax=Halobacillus yeomjeoni TaxID=311194 RepID=A0A931MUQ5_9BACI|nr:hypothetical protein [Halobacillus yeomjeoni]MBH0230022.1 hypothetical protein [Halobacillus yeomjeoni]
MKIEVNKLSIMLFIGAVLFSVLFIILGNRFFIDPLEDEVKGYKKTLQAERKILSAIQENQKEELRKQLITSRTIQQQLPVIPLLDQLLIGFDRAENSTTSLIQNIGISDREALVALGEEETNPEDGENVEGENEEAVELEIIEGLHQLDFSIQVTSKNYKEMISFLEEIKSLPRVSQIESIQFDAPENENELGYTLLLSTYYLPVYSHLANEAPQYHYGGSYEKVNPFSIEQLNDESFEAVEDSDTQVDDTDENLEEDSTEESESSEETEENNDNE